MKNVDSGILSFVQWLYTQIISYTAIYCKLRAEKLRETNPYNCSGNLS